MTLTLRDWAAGDSPLHRMDSRWKVVAVLSSAVAVVLSGSWQMTALAMLATIGWLRYAGLPFRWLGWRLASIGGFVVAVSLVLPVTIPGQPGKGWALGPLWISQRGVELAALITLRVLVVSGLALLLLATTPLDRLTRALLSLRVPNVLVLLLSMSLRYVHLLGEQLVRMRQVLRTRAYQHRFSRHSYRTAACLMGNLVVRSQERAERIAQALHCRGFTGQMHMLPTAGFCSRDVLVALMLVSSTVLVPWMIVAVYRPL